ncbi:MAG: condensation domain-containing protein, partial [Natronosporangium sp.]
MVTAPASTGGLRSRLAQLSPQQRALLAQRLREQAGAGGTDTGDGTGAGAVPRRSGPAPLSFAQERMWFHEQYAPGTTAYTMTMPIRLRGALDLGVLHRALRSLVGRHESLRMRFPATAGGEPTVEVSDQPRVP